MARKAQRVSDPPGNAGSSTSLIGQGCQFTGGFFGTGDLIVFGELEGDCQIDGSITIAASGKTEGHLSARNVIVAGQHRGDLTASDQVEIQSTARIEGVVTAARISIAKGAVIDGELHSTSESQIFTFAEKRVARG